ncbi:MAG TPA: hypothetical protein VKA67_06805, partial [Verrucomicrobiae bacterium]|nr:hypothetical protein [Verrucomicrobiae bacterium]
IGEIVASALPVTASPIVNIARDPDGDVRVTFTGTLQSSTNLDGTFDDVPGSPQGSYQSPQQWLRARGD